jgi:hypothetical protein
VDQEAGERMNRDGQRICADGESAQISSPVEDEPEAETGPAIIDDVIIQSEVILKPVTKYSGEELLGRARADFIRSILQFPVSVTFLRF